MAGVCIFRDLAAEASVFNRLAFFFWFGNLIQGKKRIKWKHIIGSYVGVLDFVIPVYVLMSNCFYFFSSILFKRASLN